jgi:hypothetical protein
MAEDGHVLQATGSAPAVVEGAAQGLIVGEQATSNRRYRAILSFNTSALPAGATITSAKLTLTRTSATAQVSGLGSLVVDIKSGTYGTPALEASDWGEQGSAPTVATFPPLPAQQGGKAVVNLNDTGRQMVNKGGITQLRVRFDGPVSSATVAETMTFGSGENTNLGRRPLLEITYTTP